MNAPNWSGWRGGCGQTAAAQLHNEETAPFVWTKTASEILDKVREFGERTLVCMLRARRAQPPPICHDSLIPLTSNVMPGRCHDRRIDPAGRKRVRGPCSCGFNLESSRARLRTARMAP